MVGKLSIVLPAIALLQSDDIEVEVNGSRIIWGTHFLLVCIVPLQPIVVYRLSVCCDQADTSPGTGLWDQRAFTFYMLIPYVTEKQFSVANC